MGSAKYVTTPMMAQLSNDPFGHAKSELDKDTSVRSVKEADRYRAVLLEVQKHLKDGYLTVALSLIDEALNPST